MSDVKPWVPEPTITAVPERRQGGQPVFRVTITYDRGVWQQDVRESQAHRLVKAWRQGYVAASLGQDMWAGPYRETNYDRPLRDAWRFGFTAFQKDKAAAPGAAGMRAADFTTQINRKET